MPKRFRSRLVWRYGNRIEFLGKLGKKALREFLFASHDTIYHRGYKDIVLDFRKVSRAYPNGMMGILAITDSLKHDSIDVSIELPEDEILRSIFKRTNWAHFLEPSKYEMSDTDHDRHLAVHRYLDHEGQTAVVNKMMDVVMRNMTLSREIIAGLEWSINEITDNVLNHAKCPDGGLVQLSTYKDHQTAAFAVADSGRGVLSSLREGIPALRNDSEALGEAVKAGVTRSPDAGQGNGLAGTMRIAVGSEGSFEITSGQAQFTVFGGKSEVYGRPRRQRFPGTLVAAQFGLNKNIDLAVQLGFGGPPHHPVDLIEVQYETDAGDALRLRMIEETTGFGSRLAGLQLRTKCGNLLNAEPSKPLILDWEGIPIISSSFADEFIGRLFVELGPIGFASRIRNVGMEGIIRTLVDAAVMQRVSQVAAATKTDITNNGD